MDWPKYETYQDVKNNLAWWSGGFMVVVGVPGAWLLTDLQTKLSVWEALGKSIPGAIGVIVVLASVLTGVGYFLAYIMRLHEYWEKVFQPWRKTYDVDFIIPRLAWPVSGELPSNFLDRTWELHEGIMKQAYYPFVGDREPMISKNRLVRFYEKITPFWFTHVVDGLSCVFSLAALFFALTGHVPARGALWMLLGFLVVALIARHARGVLLWEVRQATLEEIDDIHDDAQLREQLKNRLQKTVCGGT